MTTESIQHKIKFLGVKVFNCSIKATEEEAMIPNELKFDIYTRSKLKSNKGFYVYIKLDIQSLDNSFVVSLESKADFDTEAEIDENFLSNNLVTINAPAIAFPFIRAYITTVTINAGYNAVILPAINFIQLKQESDRKSE